MKDDFPLTPELLVQAYAAGVFPMSESQTDTEVFWVDPKRRGVFPLDRFHVSRSLARRIRRGEFSVTADQDFPGVLAGCADREETWISETIARLYVDLHHRGLAHSIEVRQDDHLVGGVYGVALGGAFFGESMFSRRTDASKVALAYLVSRLRAGGFVLFDTQFLTSHLASLGAVEISRAEYRARLSEALSVEADFHRQGPHPSSQEVLQRWGQTS
ncbi:leucyl/phenylalanyl-tRNA--protein transferase [Ponticoccus sp. SC2-23]|uniref:leucyl/phenylalanyl-tRNA--protein transferase n=1 Tax=Alexandriicola marinus TaxID=2081710 RepID=UPI000FDACEF5|nr:leucyl/phenylalanyl-tRNA--protein transferase [Alexandriicola marinus]MBM1219543.1 leucyl/phenylalanyl-tRNA--protein transferase [Ponticoccus sp. SC6-9]MBM1223385.1 leucyl/phenylalanyl-tRNA--protein transferase [Ponticoccus sp. SC6-15]MBM1229356.1 leucyl/phenylalanyl-tRNA--protein transferase [Ponticoccus sp. SC6-38]MBM1232351.1 leucyl/phenylalanyl-tRNA--protein transferase [Ponticoccus sp. SC6-45]MBM1237699.1 leucyl/phenylalanyl-tRNA--protein transferase [Ponticoccus sp. SC6-49]MBM1241362